MLNPAEGSAKLNEAALETVLRGNQTRVTASSSRGMNSCEDAMVEKKDISMNARRRRSDGGAATQGAMHGSGACSSVA